MRRIFKQRTVQKIIRFINTKEFKESRIQQLCPWETRLGIWICCSIFSKMFAGRKKMSCVQSFCVVFIFWSQGRRYFSAVCTVYYIIIKTFYTTHNPGLICFSLRLKELQNMLAIWLASKRLKARFTKQGKLAQEKAQMGVENSVSDLLKML